MTHYIFIRFCKRSYGKQTFTNLSLESVVAQFTAKTTNSEKAIYFLSLMTCSINKLKSHILFTCKNFTKILCFPIWHVQNYLLQEMVEWTGRVLALSPTPPCIPFLYDPAPMTIILRKYWMLWQEFKYLRVPIKTNSTWKTSIVIITTKHR